MARAVLKTELRKLIEEMKEEVKFLKGEEKKEYEEELNHYIEIYKRNYE